MSKNKKNFYIFFMIITILICIILAYKLKSTSEVYQRTKIENANLIKEIEDIESRERNYNPHKHVIPNDSSEFIVNNEKEALLAFLYHISLMNYSKKNEITQIDFSNYKVNNSQNGLVVFVNSKEDSDSEYIIQESDNHEYYDLTVRSIKALKNGGSGTGARYYIYKDGYVVSAVL